MVPSLALADEAADAEAADAADPPQIVVSGSRMSTIQQEVRDIPGAGAIIDSKDVERGRNASLEDLLAYQPGVFVQAADGTGAVKISIRGSGVQTSPGYFREGIKFLYDGLPLTGPGGTPDEMLDGFGVNYTEVLYGANATKYSAAALGGAINYTTHTGLTAPGIRTALSYGSFENRRASLSIGGVAGDLDYYVAAQHDAREGYREGTYQGQPIHNYGNGTNLVGNFGWQATPNFDLRLTGRFREERYVNGTTLTLAQLLRDPQQLTVISARRKKGSVLLGLTAGIDFADDSRLEIGAGFSHYPHINAWKYALLPAYWNWYDYTGTLLYSRSDTLFGLKSNTTFNVSGTYNDVGEAKTYNRDTGVLYNHVRYSGSYDLLGSIGNDLQLIDGPQDLWLTTGLTLTQFRRNVRVLYSAPNNPNLTPFGRAVDRTDTDIAPRVGARFQITPEFQLVGNVSRSIDPPSSWGLAGSSSAYVRDLRPQKATTYEIGGRLNTNTLEGSLSLYRAHVKDELLTIVLAQATQNTAAVIVKANASPTLHQGIEAGLTAKLWGNDLNDSVSLRQAYTLNDFKYRNDELFGDNQLPGLPKHSYQAELQYENHNGFYFGVNVRAASSYYVDYGNSLKAPSYAIYGARAGFEDPRDRFKLYLDLRNLANKTYVSAISPQFNLNGVDSNVFYPGEGFSVFTGLSVNF